MSDYHFATSLMRGELAQILASNEEQFLYVLSDALQIIGDLTDVIDEGSLSEDANHGSVILQLRQLADAIEEEHVL